MAAIALLADEAEDVAKRAPINEAAVASHVAMLQGAGIDREAFERAFAAMKSDGILRAGDVLEIAARYTGTRKSSSKGAAIAAIAKQIVILQNTASRAQRSAKARLV